MTSPGRLAEAVTALGVLGALLGCHLKPAIVIRTLDLVWLTVKEKLERSLP